MEPNPEITRVLSSLRNLRCLLSERPHKDESTTYFFGNPYFTRKLISSSSILSHHPFQSMNTSLCQESPSSAATPPRLPPPQQYDPKGGYPPSEYEYDEQRLKHLLEEVEKPCSTCKYTGVAVCTGLSLYFLKLALEDTATAATKSTGKSHKTFFYGGAVTWAIAGVYRSMLDY